jgi:hypothetical protein
MASQPQFAQRAQLAQETRKRFVAEAGRALVELGTAAQERLTVLMNEAAPSREMQTRRDVMDPVPAHTGSVGGWHLERLAGGVKARSPCAEKATVELSLELVATDEVENKIVASRLVMAVTEKVSSELNDLRLRIRYLDGTEDLDARDALLPDVLLLLMIERWASAGMPREAWPLVNDVACKLLIERFRQAYASANEFLIKQGVMPTIELKDRVKRVTPTSSRSGGPGTQPGNLPARPERPPVNDSESGGPYSDTAGVGYTGPGASGPYSGRPQMSQQASPQSAFSNRSVRDSDSGPGTLQGRHPGDRHHSDYGSATDETRMMTSATPLARARSRALGVMGQLKRLLMGTGGTDFEATHYLPPSPALAAAMEVRPAPMSADAGDYSDGGTVMDDYSPAAVAKIAGNLRQTQYRA